jgi:hypothetical protein
MAVFLTNFIKRKQSYTRIPGIYRIRGIDCLIFKGLPFKISQTTFWLNPDLER